jgi:NAD(P)-dependent dehydrogenase (short-subunit alcohol dehydrogenase family)
MTRFAGKRALVTGGASGIGLATAELLRREGAEVALLDRSEKALAAAAARLGAAAFGADVLDPAAVAWAVGEATEAIGPPDVLVNSAGVYRIAPLLAIDVAEWDEVLDVNLRGSFLVAREAARRMIAVGRGGAIVNISSMAGLVADVSEPTAAYNASKAGVIALTKQMAAEWAPHRIRVNCVCPGVIDTPMLRLMDDPEAGRAYLEEHVPLRRLGRADEVAALIAFLASDDASYITGAAVPVDGGATIL